MNTSCPTLTVSLSRAKADFLKLVQQANAGQVITITKHGLAFAQLVTARKAPGRRIGAMKGKLIIPDDFDEPLSDSLLQAFEKKHLPAASLKTTTAQSTTHSPH
ncbi:prevent-host-death family protein [Pseudomonas libanensis]|uniref:type II toxin-antitoxin system Phd/YefM family antitoxin n=1 Tax=Pseudomonas libanensis TaxID=75588 RepID=UPI00087ACD49|nr:type II toxin-antitoxin system prevent-host-death family antitoxin [Pseudomonas libanensis]SDK77755.1 prevent-host-death family protein [Pseudomonas libanensis]